MASVATASESCDGGIAMDIDMVDDCVIPPIVVAIENGGSAPRNGAVGCTLCCDGVGEAALLPRDGGRSRSTTRPTFFLTFRAA